MNVMVTPHGFRVEQVTLRGGRRAGTFLPLFPCRSPSGLASGSTISA